MYITRGHWYSIIRYTPSKIRNEVINIGVLFYSESNKKFQIDLISPKSPKIKAFLNSSAAIFDFSIVLEVLSDTIDDFNDTSLFTLKPHDLIENEGIISGSTEENLVRIKKLFAALNNNIEYINLELSIPLFIDNDSLDQVKNILFEKLVYKEVHRQRKGSIFKQTFEEKLSEKNLIDVKVKKEIMIQPVKQIDRKYKTDFAYLNGRVNLLFFAPEELNILDNWQDRIMNLNRNLSNEALIKVIYSADSISNKDNKVTDLLRYLKAERVESFEQIEVSNIENEIRKIERHAQSTDRLSERLRGTELIS